MNASTRAKECKANYNFKVELQLFPANWNILKVTASISSQLKSFHLSAPNALISRYEQLFSIAIFNFFQPTSISNCIARAPNAIT